MFEYRFIKYKYDINSQRYHPIKFNCEQTFETLLAKYKNPSCCYTDEERKFNHILYGDCEVDVPKKSIVGLLVNEILNPFYLF